MAFTRDDIIRWVKVWQDANTSLTSDASQADSYLMDNHWLNVLRIVNCVRTAGVKAIHHWDGQRIVDWRPPDHDTLWDGQYLEVVDWRATDYDTMNLILAIWSETEDGSPVDRMLLTVDVRDKNLARFFPPVDRAGD